MRPYVFILAMIATLAAAQAALARGGHSSHGPSPHGPSWHGGPAHGGRHPPHRQAPAPQGWVKVGKHVYTTATWRGGRKGSWSTDVPF